MGQSVSKESSQKNEILKREEIQALYLDNMEDMYGKYLKGEMTVEELKPGLNAQEFAKKINETAKDAFKQVAEGLGVFGSAVKDSDKEFLDRLIENATDIFVEEHSEKQKPFKKRKVEPSTQVQIESVSEVDRKMPARDAGPNR